MRGRWQAAGLVAAGIALLVVATRACGDGGAVPSEETSAPAAVSADANSIEPHERIRVKPQAADPMVVTDAVPSADAASVDGFPTLDVRVVHADGSAAAAATVYAVRAGAPGRRHAEHGPHARTNDEGRCRLIVPSHESYDVGAVSGAHHGLAMDVSALPAGSAEHVEIALSPAADVVVEASESAAAQLTPGQLRRVYIHAMDLDDPDCLPFPGRAERLHWLAAVYVPRGETEVRVPAPRDRALGLLVQGSFTGHPLRFRAPATVSLDTCELIDLHVIARVIPAAGRPAPGGFVQLRFTMGEGEFATKGWVLARIDELPRDEVGTFEVQSSMRVKQLTGRLHWRGDGVISGETDIGTLQRGVRNERTIDVRLDGTALPTTHPSRRETKWTRLRVTSRETPAPQLSYFVAHAEGGGMGGYVRAGKVAGLGVIDATWVVAHRGLEVAGPTAVSEVTDAVNELELALGGTVTLVVERVPPAALGKYVLTPREGGVVLVGSTLLGTVGVRDGLRLGPLPVGEHAFELRLGGERVGELSVYVGPGTTQTVVVPSPAPAR